MTASTSRGSRADLRQATLDGVSLTVCDLRGADLRGTAFGAVLTVGANGWTVLTGALRDAGALAEVEATTVPPRT